MVLVCHFSGKSWVIKSAFWEKSWEVQAQAHISDPEKKFMYDRARALTLAHNIHNRLGTEYGVCLSFLERIFFHFTSHLLCAAFTGLGGVH